jgi:hypothetical protein
MNAMAAYGGCSTKRCEASLSEEEDTCMSYEEEMSYEDKRCGASLSKTRDKEASPYAGGGIGHAHFLN